MIVILIFFSIKGSVDFSIWTCFLATLNFFTLFAIWFSPCLYDSLSHCRYISLMTWRKKMVLLLYWFLNLFSTLGHANLKVCCDVNLSRAHLLVSVLFQLQYLKQMLVKLLLLFLLLHFFFFLLIF